MIQTNITKKGAIEVEVECKGCGGAYMADGCVFPCVFQMVFPWVLFLANSALKSEEARREGTSVVGFSYFD